MATVIREQVFHEEEIWKGRSLSKPVYPFSVRRFILPQGQRLKTKYSPITAFGFFKSDGTVFFVPAQYVRLVYQRKHQRNEETGASRVLETYAGEVSIWLFHKETDNFSNLERGYAEIL